MKPPLRMTNSRKFRAAMVPIMIFDDDNKMVCTVPYDEEELANDIVKMVGKQRSWWHRIFGPPRDARQLDYDKWVGS